MMKCWHVSASAERAAVQRNDGVHGEASSFLLGQLPPPPLLLLQPREGWAQSRRYRPERGQRRMLVGGGRMRARHA